MGERSIEIRGPSIAIQDTGLFPNGLALVAFAFRSLSFYRVFDVLPSPTRGDLAQGVHRRGLLRFFPKNLLVYVNVRWDNHAAQTFLNRRPQMENSKQEPTRHLSECKACLYYQPKQGVDGLCRRYPPRVVCVPEEDSFLSCWPQVREDDACGEYKTAERPTVGTWDCRADKRSST